MRVQRHEPEYTKHIHENERDVLLNRQLPHCEYEKGGKRKSNINFNRAPTKKKGNGIYFSCCKHGTTYF